MICTTLPQTGTLAPGDFHRTPAERCALIASANAMDPIGMALAYDLWLLLELPTPWPADLWHSAVVPPSLREYLERTAAEPGPTSFRPLALAPDPAYATPGHTRVLTLRRPAPPFSSYAREEYLVPTNALDAFIAALLERPMALPRYERYRRDPTLVRDLLVCTHGAVDACCGLLGYPLYQHIRDTYAQPSNGQLRVWRVSHFGGHVFAPTLIDAPEMRFWAYVDDETVDRLITHTGPLPNLERHYRGWGGLDFFAQVLEREAFADFGWQWTSFDVRARMVSSAHDGAGVPGSRHTHEHPAFTHTPPTQVDVTLDFTDPCGPTGGAYAGSVELASSTPAVVRCGAVPIQRNSYRLRRIERYQQRALALAGAAGEARQARGAK